MIDEKVKKARDMEFWMLKRSVFLAALDFAHSQTGANRRALVDLVQAYDAIKKERRRG